ncbi:MAG TPA: lysylphosphatidylglycerol synthase transmembrane domain-containing protein [Baekduia sp.]|uniref:lysylphosphatidylglycerol synthase transmembrane domain-containing protein n=1 Tax=Baekduia sp. TaxID=2600305 RepID=UPI002C62B38D|nr:lysylphosphatidylglycerol synthase transmembrane domain-containing protein [Baekduia sp.]HMJ36632.1 lysylphosphatidylglycerol synthase transmembrane domain-containing protein [Baekduia sp.]
MLNDVLRTASHALELLLHRAASVDPTLVVLGIVLYIAAQCVRTLGWHAILRAAYPEATELRRRDTMCAYLAGAGLNGVIPARGGDIVKLWLLHRRIRGARYPTLAATFLPETLFETFFGFALVVWALSQGFLPVPTSSGELPHVDVTLLIEYPLPAIGGAVALGAIGYGLYRLLRRRISDLTVRLRQGVAILRTPRRFVTSVASWQALGRLIRLGSLAAFMAAFHLPVTAATVVLVMAAQGGGRIIPLAPASAGLRLAMLSYGFVETTGHAVDIAAITTFTFGVGALLMLSGLIVGLVALGAQLGTYSPRVALAAAREAVARHRAAASAANA